jgi:hypothetical protein
VYRRRYWQQFWREWNIGAKTLLLPVTLDIYSFIFVHRGVPKAVKETGFCRYAVDMLTDLRLHVHQLMAPQNVTGAVFAVDLF